MLHKPLLNKRNSACHADSLSLRRFLVSSCCWFHTLTPALLAFCHASCRACVAVKSTLALSAHCAFVIRVPVARLAYQFMRFLVLAVVGHCVAKPMILSQHRNVYPSPCSQSSRCLCAGRRVGPCFDLDSSFLKAPDVINKRNFHDSLQIQEN